ncbi:MAG TPA: restriction endonuclease [Bryobacteraceae bacterium]|nr:restriction endonuclease [Bryobacteraceae bacterium]
MTNVWCVRANRGEFTSHFLAGGYAAIGWSEITTDLSSASSKDDLYALVRAAYPDLGSPVVQGNYVGQIARFLWEIKAGDYIITPSGDTELLHYGQVEADPSYFYGSGEDGCRYLHRRKVTWSPAVLRRGDLSVPFQNTIRSMLTVFYVSQREEFLSAINRKDLVGDVPVLKYDPYEVVLHQILELDDKEFEILVGHLLTALGFEGSEVTGKTGDGGVDAIGELNVFNLAKVKVFVQAKRYKLGTKISASTVRQLRQAIPFGGQGGFITTADFQGSASDTALEPGFPRIGLINGRQLVDLLVEHWQDIPTEFQDRLGLKPWLVKA